jgi:glutathione S-transferase
MQLIGMLDSPYVRRVAVSLKLLGIPFEHRAVSVFRHFDAFASINPAERQCELRLLGLVLAGCEKAVQFAYEGTLRPPETQHAPWLDRVRVQMDAAWRLLEAELVRQPLPAGRGQIGQAGVTVAVAWGFVQSASALQGAVEPSRHPAIAAYAEAAERLPEFVAAAPG